MHSRGVVAAAAVDRIANDRMSDAGEMCPQLMRTSGEWPEPESTSSRVGMLDTPAGTGMFAIAMHPVAGWLALKARQWQGHATTSAHAAFHISHIELANLPAGEQGTAASQAVEALRQENHTGCIPIQAVHQMQI